MRRENVGLRLLLAVAMVCSVAPIVRAHAVFTTHIRHDVKVTVGPVNIDVAVELTFHELRSLAERRRMDRDSDGRISSNELRVYLDNLADDLGLGLEVSVDGRPTTSTLLFEPEIDLLGVDEVAPVHHALRLTYFARTPTWLKPGSSIAMTNRLWPTAPAIDTFEVTGEGGVTVQAPQAVSRDDESRIAGASCSLTCTAVPASVGYREDNPDSVLLSAAASARPAAAPNGIDGKAAAGIAVVCCLMGLAGLIARAKNFSPRGRDQEVEHAIR